MKAASIIAFLLAVAGMVGLLLRHSLIGNEPISIGVQIGGVLLMIWARITFGGRSFHASADPTEGGLVTTGPYRYWRHPIYAAVVYITVAGLVSHFGLINAGLALLVIAGLAIRMWAEEMLVARKYPEYAAYAARTKRVIPYVL